jgi:hypothetical protein
MRKLIVAAVFVASVAGGGYAQEMSVEIQRFLDNYTIDSTADWGPLHLRRYIPDSVRIEDLRFRTLQPYVFKRGISFNDYPDTVALSELIEPGIVWRVLVMAHGEPIYELHLVNRAGGLRVQQANIAHRQHIIWGPLLEAYPEPTDINPVLFVYYNELGGREHFFLYFEQLGPRKIHYSSGAELNPTFDSLFTASIGSLDDSRILIRYLKEREINERANAAQGIAPHGDVQNIERNENTGTWQTHEAIRTEGMLERKHLETLSPTGSNQ